MTLTGPQIERVTEAIRRAYNRDELRRAVLVCMDEDFDSLVSEKAYVAQVFELVRWANRQGRAIDLLRCAHEHNRTNEALRALWAELAPPSSAPRAAASSPPKAPMTAAKQVTQLFRTPPLDIEWITIPAGEFLMGSNKDKHNLASGDETPQNKVNLAKYYIAKYPVTNAQYLEFVKASGHAVPQHWQDGKIPRGKENHPVVYVSWRDARAYCAWASRVAKCTIRLPSEAEWEKAARGTDGHIWPWGDLPPAQDLCNFGGNVGDTTPVDKYPQGRSPYSVMDMAGNVWEWTSSQYKPYPYNSVDGREKQEGDPRRTLRGGAWHNLGSSVRCAVRSHSPPDARGLDVGFRLVSPGF